MDTLTLTRFIFILDKSHAHSTVSENIGVYIDSTYYKLFLHHVLTFSCFNERLTVAHGSQLILTLYMINILCKLF